MASLSSSNPHAKEKVTASNGSEIDETCNVGVSVASRWASTVGDAVADDSKVILSVHFRNKTYIMADIRRLVSLQDPPEGMIGLEFFFDGDMKDLVPGDLLEFVKALELTINSGVHEYLRRRISRLASSGGDLSRLKDMKFPEVKVSFIGENVSDAFRDAGCMLSFIAVRVWLSEACAECIGGVAFPEYFEMSTGKASNPPIPLWLVSMGIAAVVCGIAMIYAWAQIFIYGNSHR